MSAGVRKPGSNPISYWLRYMHARASVKATTVRSSVSNAPPFSYRYSEKRDQNHDSEGAAGRAGEVGPVLGSVSGAAK